MTRYNFLFILISILFISSCNFHRGYSLSYYLSSSNPIKSIALFKNDSLILEVNISSESAWYKSDNQNNLEEIKERFKHNKINELKLLFSVHRKDNYAYELHNLIFKLIQKKGDDMREYPMTEGKVPTNIVSFIGFGNVKDFESNILFSTKFNVDSIDTNKSSYILNYSGDLLIDKLPQKLNGDIDLNLFIESHETVPIR
jgi:hypothetical protein